MSEQSRAAIIDAIESLEANDLPSLPHIITKLDAVLSDNNSSPNDVAAVIEQAPELTSRVLRLANSVWYIQRDRGEVATVATAFRLIGEIKFRNLCVATIAMRLFKNDSRYVDKDTFWTHSKAVAYGAQQLAQLSELKLDVDRIYVGGLLHEIGALVLDQFFAKEYAHARNHARSAGAAVHAVEQDEIGIDHGEVGGRLLEKWRLPADLVHAAWFHHRPLDAPPALRDYCSIIHVADYYVNTADGIKSPGPGEESNQSIVIYGENLQHLGITADKFNLWLGAMQTEDWDDFVS